MKRKTKRKISKAIKLFSKKRIAILCIVAILTFLLVNFRDIIFFPYPAIVGIYRARYNEMNTSNYLEELRKFCSNKPPPGDELIPTGLDDPIERLNCIQLLKWLHRHLIYWTGELEVRPEMPIDILTTNLLGTLKVLKEDSTYPRYAVYCSYTNTFKVFLAEGEKIEQIVAGSWERSGFAVGRCGEFALLYNGLLLANGIDSRIIIDCSIATGNRTAGDHVWNEVWLNETWIHVDPTEGIFNDPGMYSSPERWNKEVNKVYAIHGNEIEDVTETYAGNTND